MDTTAQDFLDTESEAETIPTTDATDTGPTESVDPSNESFQGKHVFISHKCDVQQDENIARQLYTDLTALGCEVYLDTAQPIGAQYDDEIKKSLKRADFVVAVLSSAANESDWVTHELSYAREQLRQRGNPIIFPIKLGAFEFSMSIGASVGRFNRRSYHPGDYNRILEDIKAGILNETTPPDITPIGMEGFVLSEFRRNLTRAANLPSLKLREALEALHKSKLFWVRGDDGVRNHFAHCLAVEEYIQKSVGANEQKRSPNIYEIPASRNWSTVDATLVHSSIIILRDVRSLVISDQESAGTELESLKNLVDRNLVIVTASDDTYSEIEQEMRNRGMTMGAHITVGHDFYDEQAKLIIFQRLLDFSSKSGDITSGQLKWATRLAHDPEERKTFVPILNNWSPADIERFVMQLRRAKRQGDVLKLVQRNAHLDDEIHEWFIALDDSTRCFVLALSMLRGLRKDQLWQKYKLIIEHLRELDSNLSLWPLGICRKHAEPYVTGDDQLDFADERIREAIDRELTKNFREYLIELVPLIMAISVPDREQKMTKEATEARKLEIDETRELRTSLARITGKALRSGLDGFIDLLDFWAVDPAFSVREAVSISLAIAVREQVGARQGLGLLQQWCNDRSSGGDVLAKSWAAASALAAIVAAQPERGTYERALDLLERLADRNVRRVRFFASISLKKAARKAPLRDQEAPVTLESVLRLVARDEKAATKINIAEALCEARIADEPAALSVIQDWISGSDLDCRWAGICCILLWRKQKREDWNKSVVRFLNDDAPTTAGVLVEILNHRDQTFLERISQFWLKAGEATRVALVAALASLPAVRLNEKILPALRASEIPALNNLAIEIRAESWSRMLSTPSEFITDVQQEVKQEPLAGEVSAAFVRLLKPEPAGSRGRLVQALVQCFFEERVVLEDVLGRLSEIGPTVFTPLSLEIRSSALRQLFQDPAALLSALNASLGDERVHSETKSALEFLVQEEPRGHRAELLDRLTTARSVDAQSVRMLVRQFRTMNIRALNNFVYLYNFGLLTSELAEPDRFVTHVWREMSDPYERDEVLYILRSLSMPEPEGRRGALVRALGIARMTRPIEVNSLLQDSSWQHRSGLISVATQVKLFSFLTYIVSPRIASGILGLRE